MNFRQLFYLKIFTTFAFPILICLPTITIAQTTPPQRQLPANIPETIERTIPQPNQLPPTPSIPSPNPPVLLTPQTPSITTPELPGDRFLIKKIEVKGNTVLHDEIDRLVRPLENREKTFEDLINLRSEITKLYIENGYINSGAFIPNNQNISRGIIQIQVVEGELERIELSGLNRLSQNYVRSRLKLATSPPLNQQRLERALQLLQLDPLISQVNAELTAGSTPGRNVLQVILKEAPAFTAGFATQNNQSPNIGSTQASVFAAQNNLLGLGDRFSAEYGISDGLDIYDLNYTIPVNARNGTVGIRYSNADSRIIEAEFADLNIESETRTLSFNVRQPLTNTPNRELALGLGLDLRRSETSLEDLPFSFSEGAEDGESRVTAIRFYQDWVDRGARRVFAARSQFSLGIDAFDATINDLGTDGRFFTWLGQFQWVQQLSSRNVLITRFNTQLTPDSLLSLERFSLGGIDTVRGYPQNQLVADNGIVGSMELRIPLTRDLNTLQLAPFFDIGTAWNNRTSDPTPKTLAGLGLGVRWLISPSLAFRLDYGIPLMDIENRGNSLQDNGIYFSLRYQPF